MSHNEKQRWLLLLASVAILISFGIFGSLWKRVELDQAVQKQEQDRRVVTIAAEEERLLVFYKDDCSDCQKVLSFLVKHHLAWQHLVFINLNQEQNRKYIKQYDLTSVPTFVSQKGRYAGTDTKQIQELLDGRTVKVWMKNNK